MASKTGYEIFRTYERHKRILREIARREFEGNVSMTIRRVIEEAGLRRGIVIEDEAADCAAMVVDGATR